MKYPKIARVDKKNCKLTDVNIRDIKRLFKEDGFSMRRLALMYKVSRVTIKYWVDEDYRARDKKRVMDKIKVKRQDPEKVKEMNKQRFEEIHKARTTIPALKKYHDKELKELNKKNQHDRR